MHYLYRITNIINNKVYIGQSNKEKDRWRQHKYFGRNPEKTGQYIHRAMAKYGIENFIYEVIAMCKSEEDANEIETMLIKQYNSRDKQFGYNLAPGGETPWNLGLPKEQNPLTGIPRSEEIRQKISQGNIGKIMPPCSEERKIYMSNLYKNRQLSEDWKNNIGKSNTGKIRTKQMIDNLSKAHIGVQAGEKHPMAKLNWSKVNEIRREYSDGNISQKQLAKKYNMSRSTISDIINNKIWICVNAI
jgi:group I intron endonuclease